jgi:hypothetical protein
MYIYSNIHQRVKGGNSTERICVRPENTEDEMMGNFITRNSIWESQYGNLELKRVNDKKTNTNTILKHSNLKY